MHYRCWNRMLARKILSNKSSCIDDGWRRIWWQVRDVGDRYGCFDPHYTGESPSRSPSRHQHAPIVTNFKSSTSPINYYGPIMLQQIKGHRARRMGSTWSHQQKCTANACIIHELGTDTFPDLRQLRNKD